MSRLPRPHGGALSSALAHPDELPALEARARTLPSVTLDATALADLELLGSGALSPLRGFLGARDHRSVLDRGRLASGLLWPWPVTLPVPIERLGALAPGTDVALRDAAGGLRGLLAVSDTFVRSPREEARLLAGTDDPSHPGAKALLARPSGALGGEVIVLPAAAPRPGPREVRAALTARGRARVAALAPRGTPSRPQLYLARLALGLADVLLLQPREGAGGAWDQARIECWRRVAAEQLPADRVLFAPLPGDERHGGGREALLDALVARNHGATHLFLVHDGGALHPADALPAGASADELGIALLPVSAELGLPGGEGLAAVA